MLFEKEVTDLVNAVQQTNEFKELKKAKVNIKKYKGLKDEVELFQKKQTELCNMDVQSNEAKSLVLELNRGFKRLSQIPEVHKLLTCGKEFNDMMFKIFKTINDLLDTELK